MFGTESQKIDNLRQFYSELERLYGRDVREGLNAVADSFERIRQNSEQAVPTVGQLGELLGRYRTIAQEAEERGLTSPEQFRRVATERGETLDAILERGQSELDAGIARRNTLLQRSEKSNCKTNCVIA